MRQALLATGLALAVSVGTCTPAHADDPAPKSGNWFTNLFQRPAAPAKAAPAKKENTEVALEPLAPTAESRQRQARADWLRRQEICLKLREIALATNDDDLARKADQLDQRAYDAYVQQTGQQPALSRDAAEDTLERHLTQEPGGIGARLSQSLGGASRTTSIQGQTSRRGDP
jgi:hypothetical protein